LKLNGKRKKRLSFINWCVEICQKIISNSHFFSKWGLGSIHHSSWNSRLISDTEVAMKNRFAPPRRYGRRTLLVLLTCIVALIITLGFPVKHVLSFDGDGEYIKEWLVVGPFFPDNLDTDFLADAGGEANIHPKEGDAVTTTDGTPLTWKRYTSESNVTNLLDAVGKHEYATAYAFCLLQSEIAGDVEILLGNDDEATVWVDGKQAHRNPGGGSVTPDQHQFEVDLKAGKTPCLVKVAQQGQAWGFAMRVLPINRAMISGLITDEKGQPIPNADVRLEQDGQEMLQTKTDASGSYRMSVYPVGGKYDLSVTAGVRGDRKSDLPFREGDRQNLNFTLKEAISISGTLLMLDDATPHVAVVVQAVTPAPTGQSEPTVVATTLSDESGRYRFINLKPGPYQVRCYTKSGYVYYQQREVLHVKRGKAFLNIDFRFAPFKKGVWRHYTPLDGLVHNTVNRIYVEPNGVMWFGTERGISRYDGKTFVNFTTEDGFSNSGVWAIHRTPDGVMWFGTWDAGVSRYDGKGFVNFTTKDGLAANRVYYIFRTPDGAMWFWTEQGAVSRYDGRAFINFSTIKEAFASNYFMLGTLQDLRDSDGGLWFPPSWGGGVSRYDGKAVVNFTTADGLPSNSVKPGHRYGDGSMWFVTHGGVSRYDGKRFLNFTTKDGLVGNSVSAISRTPDGVMWFGIWGGGVSRYDGKGFVNFTTADGLLSNVVKDLHLGDDGVLWVATGSGIVGSERGGISRYDEKGFVNFTTKDGLAHNHIIEHYQDSDGVLWIGTSDGVSRYDGHQFVNYTTADGLTSNPVTAISRALDGAMWFGTSSDGVFRYDGIAFVNFTTKDGLANNIVTAIHCDSDGVLWFGTGDYWRRGNGVSRYDGERFLNFTTKEGLADNSVLAIHRDRDGMMWFGTRYNGVSRYNGKAFLNLTTTDGLVHNWVRVIHQDPDGIMWFGTAGGVSRYDGNRFPPLEKGGQGGFINFTTKDGLASNYVRAIHHHTDGIIWFATGTRGVSGYDGIAWTSLDTRDGLAGNTVSSISQATDGSLWFGTDGGMTQYRRSHTKPTVHIVSVTTDQTYRDFVTIPAMTIGTRAIFVYNAIDFKTIPEKRQYRVRIIGDNGSNKVDWQITKDATFNHLFKATGTYTFEVVAIDRDINYSLPASVTLKVVPPWYLNGWIAIPSGGGILALLVGFIFVGYRYYAQRRESQRLREQMLEQERQSRQEVEVKNEQIQVLNEQLTDENLRMAAELEITERIQRMILPSADELRSIAELDIAGYMEPADDVGGDYYDVLQREGTVAISIGDVTGHGLESGLVMLMTQTAVQALLQSGETDPVHFLDTLNRTIYNNVQRMDSDKNLTLCLLDYQSGTLKLSGQHEEMIVVRRDGKVELIDTIDLGFPIGLDDDIAKFIDQTTVQLQPGDGVVLYTDGITESENTDDEQYGLERLCEVVSRHWSQSAEAIKEAVISDVRGHIGEQEVYDDITLVVLKQK